MRNDMKATLYYLMLDYRFSFIVFWSIMCATLVGFVLIGSIIPDVTIYIWIAVITLIFSSISGFHMTRETFSFCVKMGLTRNQYLLGAGLFTLVLALAMSVMHLLIQSVYSYLVQLIGLDGLTLYSIFNIVNISETWYNELAIVALLNFIFVSVGFLFGTIFYRFGLIGGLSSVAVLLFLVMVPAFRDLMADLLIASEGGRSSVQLLPLTLAALVAFLPNWALLRRASTFTARTR
ncbi:hypothetical protein N781_02430 [Pontibacillus halophilus JSM 076056 = DSM 19796]|uniref:Uncharacterized protein n=1 Tax=Pontibacillus halophilus JSM 076056 = DSM 19796 TaxID=1385510 RepID=A0A0A5GLN9_9BACI|nr:hypothetical protein [Pontibacillus halophilus]KGX92055.1 hypothetical protein N781_02430 [Pontibacillus halophilus JSM 076056 = DSM 19796]